ncbi:MAG: arylesterase [Lachnospiraceae bacterium]|nr:arylesterase [Lachnospiraceae bacterium]
MKRILCFGDSNTYGYIPTGIGRYGEDIRWTGILQRKLAAEATIVEEGLCGRTTVFQDELRNGRRGVELLPILLESHAPLDFVIVMLGTNDCKKVYGASAEVIGKGVEQLIGQVKSISPQSKILLVSPILLGENVWKSEYDPEFSKESVQVSKDLKAVYERIAKKNECMFLAASDVANPSEADQEHLDVKGHKALANEIYERIIHDIAAA